MISVSNLYVKRGNFTLTDISFNVEGGSCLAIIGPNGSGKTTILECIAGIVRANRGKIMIDDLDVTNLPPEKRRVGYVPQDFVLLPHLSADKNVAFGLKSSASDKVKEIMSWLGISELVGRGVRSLSCGERQKVALARALAVNPKVLLLDEPLSSLDPLSRDKLRRELKNIIAKILDTMDIPVIYVTHDLSEADLMSDHLVVLNNGRIEQIGPKSEVFSEPHSSFVSGFLGYNILDGFVVESKDGVVIVDVEGVRIQVESKTLSLGDKVTIVLRPEDIILTKKDEVREKWQSCRCNVIPGRITEILKMGSSAKVHIDAGIPLTAYVATSMLDDFEVGNNVFLQFRANAVKPLPKK